MNNVNNDEKVREILESENIPEKISPENMKAMLDKDASARKRESRISIAGRIIAAAAACAVIAGGAVGSAGLMNRRQETKYGHMSDENSKVISERNGKPETAVELEQVKAPYMNSAESYEQIYDLVEKAYENSFSKENGGFITGDLATGAIENEIADQAPSADFDNNSVSKGEGQENPQYSAEDIPDISNDDVYFSGNEEANETEREHSGTYNQEAGVLEADIVKTDGERIYCVNNEYDYTNKYTNTTPVMNIVAVEDGIFTETYQLDLSVDFTQEGDGWQMNTAVEDMYLYDDMLAVIGMASAYRDSYTTYGERYKGDFFWEEESSCFVSFYTTDTEPQLIGIYWQDGGYSDVRIAPDGYMYLVTTYSSAEFSRIENSSDISAYIPKCGIDTAECIEPDDILLPTDYVDNCGRMSYTVIGSIDLTVPKDFSPCDTKALAGYTGNLYSSADNIYTTAGWENTDITRISVSGGSIVPEASGTVEGWVKDQFSMSEYNGYFRIATTVDKWTDNGNFMTDMLEIDVESEHISDNRVYVLDMDMNTVGSVGGFGENETVKSVNFSGNMGYVVTYEQTDPLFAIDLSDPAEPFITDEFKILGYSTYMQQWADGQLLGFGADADENGIETGIKLVMFDNSDPYDLKEIGLYAVNRENAEQAVYSEALWERKGLLIAPEKNLIGVPVNVCDFDENISKYMFFSYEDGEFILRGELSSDIDYEKNNSFERALYIGDYVYAVSGTHFISADIETMSQTDEAYFD